MRCMQAQPALIAQNYSEILRIKKVRKENRLMNLERIIAVRTSKTVYRDGDNGKGETLDITFKLDAQE